MYTYKKPDLNAPRFRPETYQVLNIGVYKDFIAKNPKYSSLSYQEYKQIIHQLNGAIWNSVITHRDGFELPEQLGYIFIGSCNRKKKSNPDYFTSVQYGRKIENRNWESDEKLAKIFYTSYETKYRFKNHDIWGFQGVRQFKRTVAQEYPKQHQKYHIIDNFTQISKKFRKSLTKIRIKGQVKEKLKDYDEFSLD